MAHVPSAKPTARTWKPFLGFVRKKYWDIKKEALLDFQKSFVALDPGVTDVDNEQSPPVFHAALQDDSACCHHQLRREPATFRPAARASTTWRPQLSSDQMWSWSVGSLVCGVFYMKLIEKSRRDKNPYCERSRISWSLTGLWTLLKWKEVLRAPIVLGWNLGDEILPEGLWNRLWNATAVIHQLARVNRGIFSGLSWVAVVTVR